MVFKLPELGNKLFIPGDYSNMSYVGVKSPLEHMDLYARGYKDSADELVEKSVDSNSNLVKDSLVYPVMFLYRHFIELRLKEIYLRFSDNPDTKNLNHNLTTFLGKAKGNIVSANSGIDKKELAKTLSAAEDYIKQFEEKDLMSFTYRYPFPKNKKADDELKSNFEKDLHIDLLNLKERMHELECLFYGTIAQLEYLEESRQENLAEMRNYE